MARIRTIKPEFWTSEQIVSVSRDARLLFIGIWNFCDDGGNHPASYITVKANVLPIDDISIDEIRRLIDELLASNLLATYEHSGKSYWHVTGWHHQKIDKPTFKYPEYSSSSRILVEPSSSPRRILPEPSPPEGIGKGRVKEKEGEKERVSIEDLSVEHIAVWLDKKRKQGIYVFHDENMILEHFKNYCRAHGKTYKDYVAAYQNAFEWERLQPKQIKKEGAKANVRTL